MKALIQFGTVPKHLPLESKNGSFSADTVFRNFSNPVSSIDGYFYPNGTEAHRIYFSLSHSNVKRVWTGKLHNLKSGSFSCRITELHNDNKSFSYAVTVNFSRGSK